ncbi:MAG: hypothetical protein DCC75_00475 [Proteobacteria bacterium]|nr:MAG: hypothetical protein DCC75_00475 [Pseudomonadota bacterium]
MRWPRTIKSQAGTGSTEVLVYAIGFSVAWGILYIILHWVYTTKEGRLDRRYENYMASYDKRSQKEYLERGPGGYEVKCSGIFRKSCKTSS